MIPDNELALEALLSPFVEIVRQPGEYLIDYEMGGVALNDPSQGLLYQQWYLQAQYNRAANTTSVQVRSEAEPTWIELFSRPGRVKEVALAWDNNMNPFVAFVDENESASIFWYDPVVVDQVISSLPNGVKNPRCCVDDKRSFNTSNSDIELFYIRAGNLYVLHQRERYQVEHLLSTGLGSSAELIAVGMGRGNRVQIRARGALVPVNAVQVADPLLADVVYALCRRVGLPPSVIDVSELYGETVVGYPLTTDDDVSKQIEPLAEAFFFDPTEYDRKLRFHKRGRDAIRRVTWRDLVDRDPGAFKQTVVQEDKLPIRVEVSHLDPAGGFNKNTQPAYRKSNLVKAKATEEVNLPFAATADQAERKTNQGSRAKR